MDHQKYSAIRKGLLEFVILKVVSADKVYAADILQRLRNTEYATQEGTLYPLLSRMCREQTLGYEWQESEAGPPRKYYLLTDGGKKQLAEFLEYWKRLTGQIEGLGQPHE
jgi:PadR family transcriptional regulator, regulatory protein PadR